MTMTSWFITIGKFKRTCEDCDKSIFAQETFVYHYETATSLCTWCASERGIRPTPSKKLQKYREAERVERNAKAYQLKEPTLF